MVSVNCKDHEAHKVDCSTVQYEHVICENVSMCWDFLIFLTMPTGSAETLIRRGLGSALGASPALVLEQHLGSSKIIKNQYAKYVNQK